MELLQGARDKSEYNILEEYLNTLPFYELQYGKQSYENAALMNIKCRENGITIRSTIDLIIAEIAIENNLYILDLFDNPVGCRTSLAVSQAKAADQRSDETALFSGSCSETEVSAQL